MCLVLAALFTSLFAFITITTWKVKEPYEVKFSGGKIHGEFKGLKANIQFDKSHPEASKISASIDANTIATGFFLKNSHAKDALDAEKYPTISFSSAAVSRNGTGFKTNGNLTLRGVTRPVTIYFTFEGEGRGGIFRGSFKFAPRSFNITHDGTPDELTISLNMPVTQ